MTSLEMIHLVVAGVWHFMGSRKEGLKRVEIGEVGERKDFRRLYWRRRLDGGLLFP